MCRSTIVFFFAFFAISESASIGTTTSYPKNEQCQEQLSDQIGQCLQQFENTFKQYGDYTQMEPAGIITTETLCR